MRYLRILPLIAVFLVAGCVSLSLNFEKTADLKDRYDQTAKDSNIAIHYNVKKSETATLIKMSIQNVGSVFMNSLTINYDDCCQALSSGPGTYKYKNLGNLKNKSHKNMTLNISDNSLNTVKLKYSFIPVKEDSFLVANDSAGSEMQAEEITGQIILFIGK